MKCKDKLDLFKYITTIIAVIIILSMVLNNSGMLNIEYKELKIKVSSHEKNTHPEK